MANSWRDEELLGLAPAARAMARILVQHGIKRKYAHDIVLIAQDSEISEVLFIASGHAASHTVLHNGVEVWGADFGPGHFIGHNALLGGMMCRFEVRSQGPLLALSIPASRFAELIEIEARIGADVARDISKRLNDMAERLVELAALPAPMRVRAELMRMARPIGVEDGKMIVRPGPVFTKLAKRVSSTRETVSRTVADLQRQGLVSQQPGALRIEAPEKLSVRTSSGGT